MGIIATSAHPKLLWPGVHAVWGQTYTEHPAEYVHDFDVMESDLAYEEELQVTPFGLAPIKTEGGPPTYDFETQGPVSRYVHTAYALGYIVTHEELKDNKYEIVASRRAKANAISINQTIENVCALMYNGAFVTTYFAMPDSLALCSTAHKNTTGGTFSNALSTAADLSEASLEDLTTQIMQATNDRGLTANLMPMSLHISVSEWYNANRILKSVLQSDSAYNNLNVLKATNALPGGIKMNHYYTNAHNWFIRTNAQSGMQMFWREHPEFDQDNDFDTKNAKAYTYMRFSVGCTDPRGIYGSNGQ
jgi:hypothetical protein